MITIHIDITDICIHHLNDNTLTWFKIATIIGLAGNIQHP